MGRRRPRRSATCWPASTRASCKQREWRRGELPPGQLGWRTARTDPRPTSGRCSTRPPPRCAPHRRARSTSRSTSATAGGCVGTVPEVYGDRLVSVTYSRLGRQAPPRGLGPAARAGRVRRRPQTGPPHTIGRPHSRSRDDTAVSLLGPLDHRAADVLRDLVALRDRGLREPLPLPLKASLRLRRRAGVPRRRRGRRAGEGGLRLEGRRSFPASSRDAGALHGLGAGIDEPPTAAGAARRGVRVPRRDRTGSAALRCASGARCSRPSRGAGDASSDSAAVDPAPLPTGTTAARGERRHRQDLHRSPPWSPATSPRAGVPLDQLLVITFGRAASQELRERVREQLVAAERALADPASARADDHPVRRPLCSTPTTPRSPRVTGRLRDALAGFDAATIATTHQFCQTVLAVARRRRRHRRRRDPGRVLDDLVVEVVDDLYLRRVRPASPTTRRSTGRRRWRWPARSSATRRPGWTRRPTTAESAAGARVAFAPRGARRGRAAQAARSASCRYDDLLGRLADALAPTTTRRPATGCASAGGSCWSTSSRTPTRCSGRCSTGPSPATRRWSLIGDPKQAIYAFRGGDVVTYLGGGQHRHHPRHARHQPPQRRRPRRAPPGRAPRRRARRRSGSWSATSPRPTPARGWSARRHRRRSGSARCVAAASRSRAARSGPTTPAVHIAADCAGDIADAARLRRDVGRRTDRGPSRRRARRRVVAGRAGPVAPSPSGACRRWSAAAPSC